MANREALKQYNDALGDLEGALVEDIVNIWEDYVFADEMPLDCGFEQVAKDFLRTMIGEVMHEMYGTGNCAGHIVNVMETE